MTTFSARTTSIMHVGSLVAVFSLVALATRVVSGSEVRLALGNPTAPPEFHAELVNLPGAPSAIKADRNVPLDFDTLFGRSGQLRARLLSQREVASYPTLVERFGDGARLPGIRAIETGRRDAAFSFVTLTPWRAKLGSQINGYNIGWWPAEQKAMPSNYDNPEGFIEVTPANIDTRVSAHFKLADFVTHDQKNVWPKYVVLREELLDKLELVLTTLRGFGVRTEHVVVLSGFRSPQYNARGVGEGMARGSRHQFGDAADIIIDANRDGRMDDLNADGRIDFQDTRVIDRAVQLVEQKYPELVGGLGLYNATGPSGPFAHIDVRGTKARWTNTGVRSGPRYATAVTSRGWSDQSARVSGACLAEGAMAALCAGIR